MIGLTFQLYPIARVIQMIHAKRKQYQCIMRNYRKGKKKAKDFVEEPKNFLVGIAACKSTNFKTCSCEKSKKVPVKERMFLQNQRSLWIGFIGCVDVPTLLALQNKAERKHYNSKKNLAKEEEESLDPDFGEKRLASAEEQEMVDLNNTNDSDIMSYLPLGRWEFVFLQLLRSAIGTIFPIEQLLL